MRLGLFLVVTALAFMPGCATVRPQDKQFLAERGMTFGSDGTAEDHEEHVFANREGSFGGGQVTGGGCGCN